MEHCPQEFKQVRKTSFAFLQKTLAAVLSVVLIACVPCTTQGSPHNAAAAANTKNIIFVVKPKKDFTISASIRLSYTSSMELVAASPGSGIAYDDISIDSTTTARTIRADYDRSGTLSIFPSTQMLVLRFNTALAASEAFQAVTPSYQASQTVLGDSYTGDDAFSLLRVFLGDIDNDGRADSADALLALQYSTEQITLTEAQKLAADVNNDGRIDSSDSLMISQYSVETITTFWPDYSPVTLPTTANSSIRSGMVYRLENVFGQKGLHTASNAASGAYVNQTDYDYGQASQRYKLVYMSSGTYKIIPMNASGKVLSIVSGRLCAETDSSYTRQRWYIVPSGEGNLIINKAYPSQCLTINGLVSATAPVYSGVSAFGNKWALHEITLQVENFYDNGMLTRWGLTASQMSSQLNQYMQTAAGLYQEVFGISIVSRGNSRYTTTADTCTGYSTISKLNSDCISTSHNPRCKDNRPIWTTFRQAHPGNSYFTPILWTGHHTWEEQNGSRVEISNGGVYSAHSIFMLDSGDNGSSSFYYNDRIAHTVCHELGHELGAPDSYCPKWINPNTKADCPEHCWQHGGTKAYSKDCLMSNQNNAFSTYTAENMFCSYCKNDIINHINAYH